MTNKAEFITKAFKAGEALFEQGGNGDYTFIIISSSVEVLPEVNGEYKYITHIVSGDILGELATLTDKPRYASGVAKEITMVIILRNRTLGLTLLNNDVASLKPLTGQLILHFKEAEQQADYYRNKSKKLTLEITRLKERFLQYKIPTEN